MVNGEGIALLGHASDGNESAKVRNRRVIKEFLERFAYYVTDLVHMADSAVVTEDGVDLVADNGIGFISRLPATFAQEQEVKDGIWSEGSRVNAGILAQNLKRNSAFYKHKEYIVDIVPKMAFRLYRLIFVHQTSRDKGKADTLETNPLNQRDELETQIEQLEKVESACEPNARSVLDRVRRSRSQKVEAWQTNGGRTPPYQDYP